MITRKDYMEGRATFAQYYTDVCAAAGIRITTETLIKRAAKALAQGDEHLNTIPLSVWDNLAIAARPALTKPFKDRGDFFSLAGGVCVMKQAARNAVKAH